MVPVTVVSPVKVWPSMGVVTLMVAAGGAGVTTCEVACVTSTARDGSVIWMVPSAATAGVGGACSECSTSRTVPPGNLVSSPETSTFSSAVFISTSIVLP